MSSTQPMMGGGGAPPGGMGQQKFKLEWKLAFFVGACFAVGAGVIGVLDLAFFAFAPFDLINELYLLVFGVLMLTIDFPVPHPKVREYKLTIYKYLLFMTRFTGRGFWYLFLGTMIFASLWDLNISPFLGFFLGGYVVILGGASIFFGVQKSMKLEAVRKSVMQRSNSGGGPGDMCPPAGLPPPQFNEMANSLCGKKFDEEELHYIVDALSFTVKSDNVISKDEFTEWTRGRMTIL